MSITVFIKNYLRCTINSIRHFYFSEQVFTFKLGSVAYTVKNSKIIKMILITLFLSLSVVKSQINKSEFIYRVKTGYYSLQETGIKNFSFWITSDMFKNNTKSIFKDKEVVIEVDNKGQEGIIQGAIKLYGASWVKKHIE